MTEDDRKCVWVFLRSKQISVEANQEKQLKMTFQFTQNMQQKAAQHFTGT